jgi:quercetin dioxygenase-like cupin family protein
MSPVWFRRVPIAAFAVLVAASAAGAGASLRGSPPAAVRLELAAVNNPAGARGRTLGLTKVTIPAGVELAPHHHPGTQVAYVVSGALTYSVRSGSVTVMRGAADGGAKAMLRIGAGQQGVLDAGEWIVEQPKTVHSSVNRTTRPVVVYLATLFPIGSPAAIANK